MSRSQQWTACRDCGIRLVSNHSWRWVLTAEEKAADDVARHEGKGRCVTCAKRERRGSVRRYTERGALALCPHCQRMTSYFKSLSRAERDALKAEGATSRVRADGTCKDCYAAERAGRARAAAAAEEGLAYEGGWAVVRGVLRPTRPRGAA